MASSMGSQILPATLVLWVSTIAYSQQAVPPPPNPADNSPTLAVTMKFIQDNLAELSRFEALPGGRPHETISNVTADASSCMLRFVVAGIAEVKVTALSEYFYERDTTTYSIPLKDVGSLSVSPVDNPEARAPFKLDMRIPSNTVQVHVDVEESKDGKKYKHDKPSNRSDYLGSYAMITFPDQESANRIAKALNHTVELCSAAVAPSKKKLNDPF